jgi:hypothetical protein
MTGARRARRGAQRRQDSRRWCVPPAILREPDETLEGWHILLEHEGELAGALWFAFRDVTLWAAVPDDRRDGLFAPSALGRRLERMGGCGGDAEIAAHLSALARVVDEPASANPDAVSATCAAVSRWAAARGAMGTAVAFAQAGALAVPGNAAAASAVGRLSARWGRLPRAETWLRRATGLGRRSHDWYAYAESYVELGTLYHRKRLPERSRRCFVLAARACRRHGYLQLRAAALHGLSLLYADTGEMEDAERHARMAIRAYGRGHPRVPEVLHDLAELLVARENHRGALPILQRLLPGRHVPGDRSFTLALIAHAAAARDRRLYEDAWSAAWALLDQPGGGEQASRTLLELARAAARARDWLRVSLTSGRQAEQAAIAREPGAAREMAHLAALAWRGASGGSGL